MKLAGFLLLLAGWGIAISAIPLLSSPGMRTVFIFAGVGVELMGLILSVRSHLVSRG